MNEIISIGRGFCRVNVRSKAKRDRLSRMPEVRVMPDSRVIFPEWMRASVSRILTGTKRARRSKPEQLRVL